MGKIIIDTRPEYIPVHEVDVTNWRALISETFKSDITIITEQCDEILIKNLSLDELNEINYCNITVHKNVEDTIGAWLPCRRCKSSGLTDWVSKTMANDSVLMNMDLYDRDPNGYIFSLTMPNFERSILSSTPKKVSSQEFCPQCKGSGLNILKNFEIIKRFKIENC